jgi:hypothetical protein
MEGGFAGMRSAGDVDVLSAESVEFDNDQPWQLRPAKYRCSVVCGCVAQALTFFEASPNFDQARCAPASPAQPRPTYCRDKMAPMSPV